MIIPAIFSPMIYFLIYIIFYVCFFSAPMHYMSTAFHPDLYDIYLLKNDDDIVGFLLRYVRLKFCKRNITPKGYHGNEHFSCVYKHSPEKSSIIDTTSCIKVKCTGMLHQCHLYGCIIVCNYSKNG